MKKNKNYYLGLDSLRLQEVYFGRKRDHMKRSPASMGTYKRNIA